MGTQNPQNPTGQNQPGNPSPHQNQQWWARPREGQPGSTPSVGGQQNTSQPLNQSHSGFSGSTATRSVRQSSTGSSQHTAGHRGQSGSSSHQQHQVSHQQRQVRQVRQPRMNPRPMQVNRNSGGSGSHHH
jgi:hypothetical protein